MKRWKVDEIKYVRANYGSKYAKEIAEVLNRTEVSVQRLIDRHRIKRRFNHRQRDAKMSSWSKKYSTYKAAANARNIKFVLKFEQFISTCGKPCHYCGNKPTKCNPTNYSSVKMCKYVKENATIKFNGLDRVNNKKDYTIENCVPCCYTCNVMKLSMTKTKFFNHIKRILNYTKNRK